MIMWEMRLARHGAIVSPTNKDNHSMSVEAEKYAPYFWTLKGRMELVV
jgi:hypothetical protein